MKCDRLFFCQAYNDIAYILSTIDNENYNDNLIVIVNNYDILIFFERLNLKRTKYYFISKKLKTLKNPCQIFYEYYNVRLYRKVFFSNIKSLKVTVYATMIDLLTCSIIDVLKKNNEIFLGIPILESDNFIPQKKATRKVKLLSFIYGVKLQSFKHVQNDTAGLALSYVKKYIKDDFILDDKILKNIYKKNLIEISNKPFILLLDTEVKSTFNLFRDDHDLKMLELFNLLNNFNVILKGHPRRGPSKLAQNYSFQIMDNKIPVEFIDFTQCICVIGLMSQALISISKLDINVISQLNYVNFSDLNKQKDYKRTLINKSNNEIHFPENIDGFEKLINSYF